MSSTYINYRLPEIALRAPRVWQLAIYNCRLIVRFPHRIAVRVRQNVLDHHFRSLPPHPPKVHSKQPHLITATRRVSTLCFVGRRCRICGVRRVSAKLFNDGGVRCTLNSVRRFGTNTTPTFEALAHRVMPRTVRTRFELSTDEIVDYHKFKAFFTSLPPSPASHDSTASTKRRTYRCGVLLPNLR